MISAARLFAVGAVILVGALVAGPANAQSQQIGNDDPFSGMPSADNDQMSDVSGENPGIVGARTPAAVTGGDCGAGAPCGGGAVGTEVGSTARDAARSGTVAATSGAVVTVNVTVISVQKSTFGSGVLNASGGQNSAGAN